MFFYDLELSILARIFSDYNLFMGAAHGVKGGDLNFLMGAYLFRRGSGGFTGRGEKQS